MYPVLQTRIILLIGCFLIGYGLMAQTLECGSIQPSEQEIRDREELIRKIKQKNAQGRISANGPLFIPIKFHVVRRSGGTGGTSLQELNRELASINNDYQPIGVQFYIAGSVLTTIDNSDLYDFDFTEESELADGNDLNNAINVYLVGSLRFGSTSSTGYAYYPSTNASSNRIVVRTDRINDKRTLSHELGHYFNLLHTFNNSTSSNVSSRELVTRGSGANCSTTGDFVCDTPADPFGQANSGTSGCTYVGTTKDANGDLYQPALDNMMSYYYGCGNRFTPGQYARMEDGVMLRTRPENRYTLDFTPIATRPSGLSASSTSNGVLISFQDNGSDEAGYIIERATNPEGPFMAITGLGPNETSHNDGTVAANTSYYYRVRASNSTEYSVMATVGVGRFYCKPQYDQKCSPVLIADFLLQKNGTNLIVNRNTGCGDNSYSSFTDIEARVIKGENYYYEVRAVTGGSGSYFPQNVSIWIDYDHDGIFDSSELVFQSSGSNGMLPTAFGTFSILRGAATGPTRMRVRSQYEEDGPVTDPCGRLAFGEAEDYTLIIEDPQPPAIQTVGVSTTTVCEGGSSEVTFTTTGSFEAGNRFTVQVAPVGSTTFTSIPTTGTISPLTATFPDTLGTGEAYQVRVVSSQPSVSGSIAGQSVTIRPKVAAVLSGGASIVAGDSTTLTITKTTGSSPWQFTLSDTRVYTVTSAEVFSLKVAPEQSTTYTLSAVSNTECGQGTGSGSAVIEVLPRSEPEEVFALKIKVLLEGPLQAGTGKMTTKLNQRGLLPGQTPVNPTVTPTPAGQPYGESPWFYNGNESVTAYDPEVVDWVLVSLRADSTSIHNTIFRTAALLLSDGSVVLVDTMPLLSPERSYYILVEHRNHIGVMSHQSVMIENGALTYDFTTRNSFTETKAVASIGQKKIGTVFASHTADGNKGLPNQHYVINASDYNLWKSLNGQFDQYSNADYNLDAQISASDKIKWSANNGRFSLIGRE